MLKRRKRVESRGNGRRAGSLSSTPACPSLLLTVLSWPAQHTAYGTGTHTFHHGHLGLAPLGQSHQAGAHGPTSEWKSELCTSGSTVLQKGCAVRPEPWILGKCTEELPGGGWSGLFRSRLQQWHVSCPCCHVLGPFLQGPQQASVLWSLQVQPKACRDQFMAP